MYIAQNQVRMHDTDMAGILYFAKQFRFVHDALEDFMATLGIDIFEVFTNKPFVFVIVHAESDYMAPLRVGDKLTIHAEVERIGTTSFTMRYEIYRKSDGKMVGKARTVHVCLKNKERTKIPIPKTLKKLLEAHLVDSEYEYKAKDAKPKKVKPKKGSEN